MPRLSSDAQLEAKMREARRLEDDIRRLRNIARDRQRAEDDQRQKIVGRVVLAELKARPDADFSKGVIAFLAARLTRAGERALFADVPLLRPAASGSHPCEAAAALEEARLPVPDDFGCANPGDAVDLTSPHRDLAAE